MYSVFEETWAEGKAEGIIETALICGLSQNRILEMLQNNLDVPLEKAQEYLEMYSKQTV